MTFIEIIRRTKPKIIIMENVKSFALEWFCSRVEARLKGVYRYYWHICDARSYGLPQRRIRLYIVFQRIDAVLQSMKATPFAWPRQAKRTMTLTKYKKCYRACSGQKHFCSARFPKVHYNRELSASERKQLKCVLKHSEKKSENTTKLIVDLKTTRCCNYGVDVIQNITARGSSTLSFYIVVCKGGSL